MEGKLKIIQSKVDADPHNSKLKEEEVEILKAYCEALQDEEKFLFQQAKVNWLKDGDRNSKFFHALLRSRKHKSRIADIFMQVA